MSEYRALFLGVLLISVVILPLFFIRRARRDPKRRVMYLSRDSVELSPDRFFELREGIRQKQSGEKKRFEGIYILYNKTKNLYYVGQGVQVPDRVNSHFTGKGNGDVYADYKYGDKFTIRLIPLYKSGFPTLNALERAAIEAFDAFASGYNKTRGNGAA
ncbi:MAG: GIY-YIG nuclease family protein [Clostridia bacterium]|nr:GIY-YIG nuclease family protein [Clostridia bacterium]